MKRGILPVVALVLALAVALAVGLAGAQKRNLEMVAYCKCKLSEGEG